MVEFSDLGDLEAQSQPAQNTSPFADYMAGVSPFIRRYEFVSGRFVFELQTIGASTATKLEHLSELLADNQAARDGHLVGLSAAAALRSLQIDGEAIRVPAGTTGAWSNLDAYNELLARLNVDQYLLIVETHNSFRAVLDGARQQLLAVAQAGGKARL